jgi:uncharacterized repeat protein (TIGR03803 family)
MSKNLRRSTHAIAFACVLSLSSLQPCQAQTFTVLHSFTGEGDGGQPAAGLTMDQAGSLYGTTYEGGYTGGQCSMGFLGCGVVYKVAQRNSQWIAETLYTFHGSDGQNPAARVIFGPDGALYSSTTKGGAYGYGLVFRLAPPAHVCARISCPWTETILHSFSGGSDGENPGGDLIFDRAGNIYGTTSNGGGFGSGVVYELSPSNGGWTESILHSFQGNSLDGAAPASGVIFDNAGNLYGTTLLGGGSDNAGTVYKLTHSASGWTESILHSFTLASGCTEPSGGLIFDSAGNLYGTTLSQVATYELSRSNGGWSFAILHHFNVATGSFASMSMDAAGNLYGTLFFAEQEVFRLTPSDGQWTLTGFTGGPGGFPHGSVILDASGNIYTTTEEGCGAGCVFEITP